MSSKKIQAFLFNNLINLSSYCARSEKLNLLTKGLMRMFGAMALIVNGGKEKTSLMEIGQEWQRMFPAKKSLPIVKVEDNTLYAEIRLQCPLRGTGDLSACNKMMEYDRKLLEKIGGKLVVLRSQAEPNTEFCQLAIRTSSDSRDDLVPAHKR